MLSHSPSRWAVSMTACIPRFTTLYIVSMRKPITYFAAGLLFTLVLGCGGCESESMEESKEASAQQYLAYFGTYTKAEGGGEGIYAWRFDSGSGQMTEIGLAAEIVNPSFVAGRE